MGLEIFTYFCVDYPDVLTEYMEASVARELRRIHAVADADTTVLVYDQEGGNL